MSDKSIAGLLGASASRITDENTHYDVMSESMKQQRATAVALEILLAYASSSGASANEILSFSERLPTIVSAIRKSMEKRKP